MRDAQHPVNVAVDWFWARIAPDAKDTSVGGWDSHRNDLVSGKLTAQGLPRGVDTLVKEARLVDLDTCIVDRAIVDRQETWCASVQVLQALVAERSIELWLLSFA